jgi:fibro-slime domain-containing protein
MACGSDVDSTFPRSNSNHPGTNGDPSSNAFGNPDAGPTTPPPSGPITLVLRDFKLYDQNDATTDPDFENPPYDVDQNGQPSPGYQGGWDDLEIVNDTLGTDGKPVYKNASGKTLTTHGADAFQKWFNDVRGTNIHVEIPLATTTLDDGSSEYDSNKSGELYDASKPDGGRGFFPLDDSGPNKTAFGNQGKPHNYSFTGEIHTEFTFQGGEYFSFRGDDDVWVFIDNKLVINLGGIHEPRSASVKLDDLGLTAGQTYPLDFFFAERHATGSNVLFQTTLALRPSTVK